jgi:uncharacterized membrane protein YuzA (DUF378 family)
MSNSCDKNDKVHKRKYFFGCKNPIYERIKTDVPAILIAKGVRKMIDRISLILVIIGALNWGSIGLFKFDIVAWICGGQGSIVARIIYTLVALAGIWCISLFFRENTLLETNDGKTK